MTSIYSGMSTSEQAVYKDFFNKTDEANIINYSKGGSLTDLVTQAEKIRLILQERNPIWENDQDNLAWPKDRQKIIEARQWQLDRLSEVKTKLSQAIVQKQSYYQNTLMGMITKFVLKCFGLWNNGNTHSIKTAEDFLLYWDSRAPMREVDGIYKIRNTIFFDWNTPIGWVREHLDTSQFFNYTPTRPIKFTGDHGHVDVLGNVQKPNLPPVFVQIDSKNEINE